MQRWLCLLPPCVCPLASALDTLWRCWADAEQAREVCRPQWILCRMVQTPLRLQRAPSAEPGVFRHHGSSGLQGAELSAREAAVESWRSPSLEATDCFKRVRYNTVSAGAGRGRQRVWTWGWVIQRPGQVAGFDRRDSRVRGQQSEWPTPSPSPGTPDSLVFDLRS